MFCRIRTVSPVFRPPCPRRMRVADQNPPPHHTIFDAKGTRAILVPRWPKIAQSFQDPGPCILSKIDQDGQGRCADSADSVGPYGSRRRMIATFWRIITRPTKPRFAYVRLSTSSDGKRFDKQAEALGLSRSTTWSILSGNHKKSGLSDSAHAEAEIAPASLRGSGEDY
jgi:hypothetical protein